MALIHDVNTCQMLACSNVNVNSVASLMLKRAKVLESRFNTYKRNIAEIDHLVQRMGTSIERGVKRQTRC